MNCDHKSNVNTEVIMYKPVSFFAFYTDILLIIL